MTLRGGRTLAPLVAALFNALRRERGRRRHASRLRARKAARQAEWDELAHKTSVDILSMCALQQRGIIRRGEGDEVQIWISDNSLAEPCMRELMAIANRIACLVECNC